MQDYFRELWWLVGLRGGALAWGGLAARPGRDLSCPAYTRT